jgi:hypothetical protein
MHISPMLLLFLLYFREPNIGAVNRDWQYNPGARCGCGPRRTPAYCGKNHEGQQVKPNAFERRGFGGASGLIFDSRPGQAFL